MSEKKFNFVDIFGLMSFAILSDAIGIILAFIALDDFWILDLMNLFPIGYLILVKHLAFSEAGMFLTGTGLELIPWVGDLPFLTITMAINIWIANHPEGKLAEVVQKARQALPTKGGAAAKGTAARAARPGAPSIKTPVGGLQPEAGKVIQAEFGAKPALTKTEFKQAA